MFPVKKKGSSPDSWGSSRKDQSIPMKPFSPRRDSGGSDTEDFTEDFSENEPLDGERLLSGPSAASTFAQPTAILTPILFLLFGLTGGVIQIETSSYIQTTLGWNKPFAMLYFTHGSFPIPFLVELIIRRFLHRSIPWRQFWIDNVSRIQDIASTLPGIGPKGETKLKPILSLTKTMAVLTSILLLSALPWFIAFGLTVPSDLTAIGNCEAILAYLFAVPILKERLSLRIIAAVAVSVAGALVITFGNAGSMQEIGTKPDISHRDVAAPGAHRLIGNLLVGFSATIQGLWDVLYKKLACPPDNANPQDMITLSNFSMALSGVMQLALLWIPLAILHETGVELFVMPTGRIAAFLFLAVSGGAMAFGSFSILVSLVGPVFATVSAILIIFVIDIADAIITGNSPSTPSIIGGIMICIAFSLVTLDTLANYKTLAQQKRPLEDLI